MKTSKKLLLCEVTSILSGCIGCVVLGIFLVTMMFGKLPFMLDIIWLSCSFILLGVYIFSGKKAQKLQKQWDHENRR